MMKNVAFDVVNYLKGSDKTIFEMGSNKISGKTFRNIIINFALNMRANGINRSSCLALDTNDLVVATALTVAVGLIGCKWIRLTNDSVQNENIKVTHTIYQGDTRVNGIKLDDSWFKTPKGIDTSFTGPKNQNDAWMIAQSSGTTGVSKFMEISYLNYWHRTYDNVDIVLSDIKKLACLYLPLKSSTQYKVITAILNDMPVVIGAQFDELVKHPRMLIIGSLGQVMGFIRDKTPPTPPFDISVDVTGTACSKADAEKLFKYFETIRLCYGSTETARTCLKPITSIDQYNGAAGVPFPDVKLRIENDMVQIKTPRNITKYVGGEKFDWFESGDIGYVENGELFITGRKNEQLNIGGIKIDPNMIDNHIKSIRGVIDCLTFRNTDLDLKEQLCTMIVTEFNFDARVIFDTCISKFGISKTPKNLYQCDDIPKNEHGKPSRKDAMKTVENKIPLTFSAV